MSNPVPAAIGAAPGFVAGRAAYERDAGDVEVHVGPRAGTHAGPGDV